MIAIYEPLYSPGQELREAAFLPLTLESANPVWREFRVLVDMYRAGLHRRQSLTGLMSPRFRSKTGIAGSEFIAFVDAHPGADVYFINPRPELAYLAYNVWTHGEVSHPGILTRAQSLLYACGIGWILGDTPRHGPETLCYSNFWVGTERFWDDYVGGVLDPIALFLERHPESAEARAVLADTRYFGAKSTAFLPFIVERLFSTHLSFNRPSVRAYQLDPIATCTNAFERDAIRFVIHRVKQADRDGVFPEELKRWMQLLQRLHLRFVSAEYASRPHPRTGAVLLPEHVAYDWGRFDLEPLE